MDLNDFGADNACAPGIGYVWLAMTTTYPKLLTRIQYFKQTRHRNTCVAEARMV